MMQDADAERREISARKRLHETGLRRERAILIGVAQPPSLRAWTADEHLEELESLADTAGVEVVETIRQQRSRIDPATFIGKGKVEYLARRVEEAEVQAVIFDDDLSAVQVRNLERSLQRKVLDRTGLILDIFAARAVTREAQTQVELAQLEYLLPRLTRQWTHLSKQYGGIGTKGPGETQIETDRRIVRQRIAVLREKLAEIDRQRAVQRKSRAGMVRASLVGYTNVGKSTLLNLLSGAGVPVEDKLFATLDSTVREVEIGKNARILLSDTVGFIRKLPAHLVASFRSTLAEVAEADLLLHVVDITHPRFDEQIAVVDATLADIGAGGKPTVMVFNKIDALAEKGVMVRMRGMYPRHVFLSALRGMNIPDLRARILEIVEERTRLRCLRIAPPDYRIEAECHRLTEVVETRYGDGEILLRCKASAETIRSILSRHAPAVTETPCDAESLS